MTSGPGPNNVTSSDTLRNSILPRLTPTGMGWSLQVHERLTSTSDRLKDLAQAGAPEGTVVIALEQTRGRGRRGRRWHSPPGKGLYVSVLLRPGGPAAEAGWHAVAAALAVARTLERLGVPSLTVKPPNDVLAGGRKIAGVLIEPRIGGGEIEFVVAGIGVNVRHTPEDFLGSRIEDRATSCAMEGVGATLTDVAAGVLNEMTTLHSTLRAGDRPALLGEWVRRGGRPDLPGIR